MVVCDGHPRTLTQPPGGLILSLPPPPPTCSQPPLQPVGWQMRARVRQRDGVISWPVVLRPPVTLSWVLRVSRASPHHLGLPRHEQGDRAPRGLEVNTSWPGGEPEARRAGLGRSEGPGLPQEVAGAAARRRLIGEPQWGGTRPGGPLSSSSGWKLCFLWPIDLSLGTAVSGRSLHEAPAGCQPCVGPHP